MADSLISQFQREYNSPIETFRQVADITSRDAISTSRRWEGMFVYVLTEGNTYELKGGVTNTDWELISGLADAPSDGGTYGRKDGSWQLVNTTGESKFFAEFVEKITIAGVQTDTEVWSTSIPGGTLEVGDCIRICYQTNLNSLAGGMDQELEIGGTAFSVANVANLNRDITGQIDVMIKASDGARYGGGSLYSSNVFGLKVGNLTIDPSVSTTIRMLITAADAGGDFDCEFSTIQIIKKA